jgi:hypothetical protein
MIFLREREGLEIIVCDKKERENKTTEERERESKSEREVKKYEGGLFSRAGSKIERSIAGSRMPASFSCIELTSALSAEWRKKLS